MNRNVGFALLAKVCVLPCLVFALFCESLVEWFRMGFFFLVAELSGILQF